MGIREKLQRKVAKAFDGKLSDAVNSFAGSYIIRGDYDPVTEQSDDVTVTYSGRGVLAEYSLNRIDGVNILHGDLQLIALVNEVTDKPAIDHFVETADLVTGGQQRYKVINVAADPAAAHYDIQLRRA
ncbi:glutamate 5-kinase [Pluralibacter gergoviae]